MLNGILQVRLSRLDIDAIREHANRTMGPRHIGGHPSQLSEWVRQAITEKARRENLTLEVLHYDLSMPPTRRRRK
jgi:transposase-like protein